jgi:hypothetical protein
MPAQPQSFFSVRHPNPTSIAFLASLAILVGLAGCGGGSSDSSTAKTETPVPIGKGEATQNPSPASGQKAKKGQGAQTAHKPAQIDQKQVAKKIRELADSGQPIPADSPVAKKIIQSLTGNGGSAKQGKKGKSSVAKAIEEVLSPSPNGGGGSSSGGQGGAPSAGVEKILEQLQK